MTEGTKRQETSKERLQFLLSQAQADLRDGLYFEIRGDDLRIIVDVLKAETSDRYQTIMRCAAIAERVCREHADPTAGHAAASAIRKLAHATPLPQIPPLTSHPCDDGLRSVQCPGCLGKGCDWCNEGQQLRAAHETGALPHASAALKAFMSELGETMSMEDGATPADYLQRARDIREWCHDHQTCAACLEAQSLITDFDSEIPDGDMPDRLGDLLPKLKSTADAVDMVRTATLLHKRNCECEACYWIGRSPLAQRQAHAQKACEHPPGDCNRRGLAGDPCDRNCNWPECGCVCGDDGVMRPSKGKGDHRG